MDLGDRLIKLANKLLSVDSSETLGTQGGITNETANDILVPTSKAVKDYVDGKTQPATTSSSGVVQLSNDIDSSSSTVAATSAAVKQLHDFIDDNTSTIDNNTSAIGALNTSKVDKITGKGLSSNDFTDEYKGYVDAYTDCNEEHITYYYNNNTEDGVSNNPLVIEKVGRVMHLHGTWKTNTRWIIMSQGSMKLGTFRSPAPYYPIYSPQLITNGGLYEIMVSPDREIKLTNVSKSSDLTIPENTVCYVNVMWVLDW